MASLFTTVVFIAAVRALALDGRLPQQTKALEPNPTFSLPEVTEPPSLKGLVKRQNGQTVLIGPDNTCGFVSGRPGAAFTCNGRSATCALVTTSTYGRVACCNGGSCGIRATCIDYRDYVLSSACDNGCAADTYTVKCTNIATPYCGTVTFFSGIIDYYCDTSSYSTPQQIYTTWSGENDGRMFTPVVVNLDESITTLTTPLPGGGSNSDGESSSSTAPPVPTLPGDNSGSSGSSGSSTNIGAIVGGVVGGVAGLALIGLGIFFLVRYSKKKDNAPPQQLALPMAQAPGPDVPPGPGGFQQSYNPHYSQPYPPSYPPQPSYYTDPTKPGGLAAAPAQLPDRNGSTSPLSQHTDNRQSAQPTSPTSTINSGWQQHPPQAAPYSGQPSPNIPPTVHEAGGNAVGVRDYNANHHGQLHELS
ncbi:hypothetical protein GGS23DRAFT_595900 [Durotheca rogersii]|uniref:uncharacterized protein n=1 Tax=Durotheca rogersii TaxID=419775 RepID=UPI002220420F|nr:uncharacterized protein GGS23DRAFT_595900 [Durotheca rogersii]KAI5864265.1 hypothetical protein GGS23DRAFT_595900 [Durotheca rogersii]